MSWTHNEFVLDERMLCDLQCILDGSFYPLTTFMDKDDWYSVVTNMTLENGKVFSLPVNLAIPKIEFHAKNLQVNDEIVLSNKNHLPIAKLIISEYYEPDILYECEKCYGTTDTNHPYVQYKIECHTNCYYVTGELTQINKIPRYDYEQLRQTPAQIQEFFREKDWQTVIGFQTRNPMHRSHFELTKYALRQVSQTANNPKLLLQPVVGVTQKDDIPYDVRVRCYQEILKHYPSNTVCLSLLPLSMRMAGPREAVFHATIRKNYGCTHFIVGRDHAGPSSKTKDDKSFYGPYDAQKMLAKYAAQIGIIPVLSTNIVYNAQDNSYYPESEFPETGQKLFLSGTQLRKMLFDNRKIPTWFSFPEIVDILKSGMKRRGVCFYFIGLSGSGKTTHANELISFVKSRYPNREVTLLDGDEVRNHLSSELGFSKGDKSKNVRRIGWVASEIVKHGGIVICSNIAPYQSDRIYNRELITSTGGQYIEIFVDTPIDICESRDVKGLYKRARAGEITGFSGVDEEFEMGVTYDFVVKDNKIDYLLLLDSI